ncbi:MAG: hypothetical protein JST54_05820 [Deltaproteobacteria bacterium]|nr:hypothetical protein [Deltaproteobacteria bacterium]
MRKALILSAVLFAIGCGGSSSSSSSSGSTGTTAGTTTGTGTTTGGTGTTTGGNGGNTNGSTGASPMTLSGVVSGTSSMTPTSSTAAVGGQTQFNITGIFANGGTSQVIGLLNTANITQTTYNTGDFASFSASINVGGTVLSASGDPSDTYTLNVTSVTSANGVSLVHGNGTFVVAVTGTYPDGGAASGTETINTGF